MPAEDEVRLAVPATPELLRLARVTASGVASRLGFTVDEVEDLRLAIDELCFALTGGKAQEGALLMNYAVSDDGLEVRATASFSAHGPEPLLSELSEAILRALVDEHEVYRDAGGSPGFRLLKRRYRST
ncbi:MAG: hypothetical protein M3N31_00995 [Actinomycetota bacterium]|nr:hypothetical protein [Actinomycetota bacterium]